MTHGSLKFVTLDPLTDRSSYQELSPATQSAPLAPSFMLGSVPDSVNYLYYGDHSILSVGVYQLRDVGVTSHGLMVRDGYFYLSGQMNTTDGAVEECMQYGELTAERAPSRVIDEPAVLLAGPGHLIWGHWIADFLPKLFVLHLAGVSLRTAKYILPSNTPVFAFRLLALLGIKEEQLIRYEPYSETIMLRHLIAPTLLRSGGRAHSLMADAARFIVEQIQVNNQIPAPPRGYERMFLSRGGAGRDGRLLINRNEIEHRAEVSGFRIVQPEQMPLLEQIALFRGARQIVGEYGSGLHNSIFASASLSVCALRAGALHPGFLQSGICQAMGQSIGYVFGEAGVADLAQRFVIGDADFALALRLMEFDSGKQIRDARASGQPSSDELGRLSRAWRSLRARLSDGSNV